MWGNTSWRLVCLVLGTSPERSRRSSCPSSPRTAGRSLRSDQTCRTCLSSLLRLIQLMSDSCRTATCCIQELLVNSSSLWREVSSFSVRFYRMSWAAFVSVWRLQTTRRSKARLKAYRAPWSPVSPSCRHDECSVASVQDFRYRTFSL